MKRHGLYYAIFMMVMATLASVVAVSCKKETSSASMGNNNESVQVFNPREIEDMNTYLRNFKQKMQSIAKSDDEVLSLEDAAWHLSSLANFEFANANVECDDVRFDTLYAQVNITNGAVLLSDLAVAYESISTSIDKFYHSLTLDNKHFRFIKVIIPENGEIAISLMTTFTHGSRYLSDTTWYFQDEFEALVECFTYFPYSSYPASTLGRSELERVLNLKESHSTVSIPGQVYFTETHTEIFNYQDCIDPFGSPFYLDSRLFASHGYLDPDIKDNLCYLFDSALGLGEQAKLNSEGIISWKVTYLVSETGNPLYTSFYDLRVIYGTPNGHNEGGNDY